MRKIAIYGKGGIGKSTTTSNVSVALAEAGYTVMQIGCDPKSDSTKNLTGGKQIPTVLDAIRRLKDDVELEDVVFKGDKGVLCVEAGGPDPGVGCAGRGIIAAFEKLEELEAFEVYKPDVVIYDVLGDVVCGGFAMPIRDGYAQDVFIVTSGEMMALYAASNICSAVERFKRKSYAQVRGLILNSRKVANERELVEQAAAELGVEVVKFIPRSDAVQIAEDNNSTVVEWLPDSEQADEYRCLARIIMETGTCKK